MSGTGSYQDPSIAEVEGRFAIIDPSKYDTTDRAAVVAWEALQAFYGALPQLDAKVTSREFNLWTESYGGHYGPSFFRHFQKMNRKIKEGMSDGIPLSFGSLGVSPASTSIPALRLTNMSLKDRQRCYR